MSQGTALAFAFGAVLVGALVVTSGLRDRSLSEVVEGVTAPKAQAASTTQEASAAGPGGGGSSSGLASSAKAWLRGQAKQLGWSAQDWEAVIQDESGGSTTATNPSSGAFGIGQFLGSTKSEYRRYGSESKEAIPQLNAMKHYIHDRYGTPTKALEHENKYKWY